MRSLEQIIRDNARLQELRNREAQQERWMQELEERARDKSDAESDQQD